VARLLGTGQVYLLVGLLAGNVALVQWRSVRAHRQRHAWQTRFSEISSGG
jgi:hypothetical protein